ncbi:MAG: hypothetical protein HKM04_05700 [Legionellales bacterium]|nr:hypothetical protein [Legionellales bacterium]
MKDYINNSWEPILKANNLDSFEKLWEIKADWFEPPNKRRGGWSGVSRLELANPEGGSLVVFLKRQENHIYKPIRNLIKGAPTFRREMKNIQRFTHFGIPIPDPVFYGERSVNKQIRAILVTASIAPDYRSLEDWSAHWKKEGQPSHADKKLILQTVAESIKKIHKQFLKHGALVSKHIFIKYQPGQAPSVRFIDLEKTRYALLSRRAVFGDLKALSRSLPDIGSVDKSRFYKYYLGTDRLTRENAGLMLKISNALSKKAKKQGS